ncbi:MAG: signal peptidase I [Nocardioidaceae bacterium]
MTPIAGAVQVSTRVPQAARTVNFRSRGWLAAKSAGAMLLCIAAFLSFAPTKVGGPASYVVTDGISMLPHFRANGLVITHTENSYSVGDIVAYYNHQLHTVVMHRIVAIENGRYVFKGDNNNFRDSYHATKADLVGKEWVYWPGGGTYIAFLRNPVTFAFIIGVIALASLRMPRRSRRRRRHHAR